MSDGGTVCDAVVPVTSSEGAAPCDEELVVEDSYSRDTTAEERAEMLPSAEGEQEEEAGAASAAQATELPDTDDAPSTVEARRRAEDRDGGDDIRVGAVGGDASPESSAAQQRKTQPGRLYDHAKAALEERERRLEELRRRRAEEEEARLRAECTFRPATTSPGHARDPEQYFQASIDWSERRERHLDRLRQQAEREALDAEHRAGITPASQALVAKMAKEQRYQSVVDGWHGRMEEHRRRQAEAEARTRPSFKPTVHELPAFYRTTSDASRGRATSSPSPGASGGGGGGSGSGSGGSGAGVGLDRLYREALQELQERERQLEAERRRPPPGAKAAPRRDEKQIIAHVEAMLARQREAERRMKGKVERLKRDEEKFSATFQPTITKASAKLAEQHRARQREKDEAAAAAVAATTSSPMRSGGGGGRGGGGGGRSAPLSNEFLLRNEILLEQRRKKAAAAIEQRAAEEDRECSFSPKLSAHSLELAHSRATAASVAADGESGSSPSAAPRYCDPTAAHESRLRGPEFRSVTEEFLAYPSRLNEHKRGDHGGFVFNVARASPPGPSRTSSMRHAATRSSASRSSDELNGSLRAGSTATHRERAAAVAVSGRNSDANGGGTGEPPPQWCLDEQIEELTEKVGEWKSLLSDAERGRCSA